MLNLRGRRIQFEVLTDNVSDNILINEVIVVLCAILVWAYVVYLYVVYAEHLSPSPAIPLSAFHQVDSSM